MIMNQETATLAGGCFWCTEAVFKRLKGVISVMPGYAGGAVPNPTYTQVSDGDTGYAEATQIVFDPAVIPYATLLDVFWAAHNPTTLNQQGNDVGTQYRSAIFYHSEEQKKTAEESKKHVEESGKYKDPVVTEITEFTNFYPAEKEHLDFYNRNREYGYCRLVIDPKIQKLYKDFGGLIKE
ncbi:MAG: peptide-methionine (S)-S-oxide reductase [Candidatus Magasanikbacteria bacterium RIFCSPHIGHO2_01_FULL_47_8]|uniref:Peptide methionine sulfoxide reductase MsrA n=1 Tax=Candidatus Magasanikbacteria bacterium RIFCSPHIGHO2_01_FULL_47_8 TaxID=1798673 RepID=A0A1F6MBT5_9BACT|nr:MAG: peptide-methionine (S)-S-oxide reductase [Candidatus Magasanikbacteria bacterium RIFCSPHIGHO2_01_FULL_47_8]